MSAGGGSATFPGQAWVVFSSRLKRKTVYFRSHHPYTDPRSLAFQARIVNATGDLARPNASHCTTIASTDRRRTESVALRSLAVAYRYGQCMTDAVHVVGALRGIAA